MLIFPDMIMDQKHTRPVNCRKSFEAAKGNEDLVTDPARFHNNASGLLLYQKSLEKSNHAASIPRSAGVRR
jgi:hypothetical protein